MSCFWWPLTLLTCGNYITCQKESHKTKNHIEESSKARAENPEARLAHRTIPWPTPWRGGLGLEEMFWLLKRGKKLELHQKELPFSILYLLLLAQVVAIGHKSIAHGILGVGASWCVCAYPAVLPSTVLLALKHLCGWRLVGFQNHWNKNIISSMLLISVWKCVDASWMLLQYGLKQQNQYIMCETTWFQVLLLPNFIAGDQNLTIAS